MDPQIEKIIETLEEYAGPISRFVVAKQVTDMEGDMEEFPEYLLPQLVDRCIEAAIFNPALKEKAKRRLSAVIRSSE
ncbi:MAG: hypothetical protein J7L61_02935 [Thermoplasmata archaeon]|nr:hypothetical protein [Thermoplasmata archaeon]